MIRMIAITLMLVITACTDNEYEKNWEEYAANHKCHKGNGNMWKCEEPTPSWWLEVKP